MMRISSFEKPDESSEAFTGNQHYDRYDHHDTGRQGYNQDIGHGLQIWESTSIYSCGMYSLVTDPLNHYRLNLHNTCIRL
jgi:hypothetical protein